MLGRENTGDAVLGPVFGNSELVGALRNSRTITLTS